MKICRRATMSVAAFFSVAVILPASAEWLQFGSFDFWTALGGRTNDGALFCAVDTVTRDGGVTLKYFPENNALNFMLFKNKWSIPEGRKIMYILKIGAFDAWTAPAYGAGQFLINTIPSDKRKQFLHEFTSSDQFTVSFTEGNELPWILSLKGSTAAVNRMFACIDQMAPGSEPFDATPTQPFSAQPPEAPTPVVPVVPTSPAVAPPGKRT